MTADYGLSQTVIDGITTVLSHFPNIDKAILFGSRAKGTHKSGSDIDLAVEGSHLDWKAVGKLYDALDDLFLPYRFSIIVHDQNTDPEVEAHIQRVGIVLFQRIRVDDRALR